MKRLILAVTFALAAICASATTLNPIQLLNPAGSTAGQAIVSTGSSSAPAWGGVGVNGIAAIAANTLIANATGSSASPTAIAAPSCSTSSSALNWTTSGGASALTCNTAINAATLGGSTFASPGAIGSTTANSGSFTTLAASSTVSGTGFSNYLASPPAIGGTAAAAGKFTTLQATGAFTPSTTAGIVGTATNDNANAGSWGEFPNGSGSTGTLVSGTSVNATSVSLSAGDWDCRGQGTFVPTASNVIANLAVGLSTTSATLPSAPAITYLGSTMTTGVSGITTLVVMPTRFALTTTTTLYLVVNAGSSSGGSGSTANGYIQCRRVR